MGKVSDLPIDGKPEKLSVFGKRYDAWTRLPDERLCEVFVRREPKNSQVSVLPAWHSELLIPLRHNPCLNRFESICWNVAFDVQGKEIVASGVGAAGTDLERFPIKIRSNEIWISLEGNSK